MPCGLPQDTFLSRCCGDTVKARFRKTHTLFAGFLESISVPGGINLDHIFF